MRSRGRLHLRGEGGWKLGESESNEADDDGACEFSGFWINREAIERRKEKCPLWH